MYFKLNALIDQSLKTSCGCSYKIAFDILITNCLIVAKFTKTVCFLLQNCNLIVYKTRA